VAPPPASATADADELQRLRAAVQALEARQQALEQSHDERLLGGRDHVEMAAMHLEDDRPPLRITASVTLRYDNFILGDPTDLVGGPDYVGGFRTRVRLGAIYSPEDDLIEGGVRLVVGENPNPAASFVPIGNVAAATSLGFDQYYFAIRPFTERSRLRLAVGKMPNPLFTGWSEVAWRSELVFDQDVMPAGLAMDVELVRTEDIRVTNLAAYYVVQDIENIRFQGRTGTISLFVDQVRFDSPWLAAAATYYHYSNLNSGLHAPGLVPGDSADLRPGQNAFLMRANGLQQTNNRVNYGPNAAGFMQNNWDVLQLTLQGKLSLAVPGRLGHVRVHGMLDVVHNVSATRGATGVSGTLGARLGSWDEGTLHPLDLWFTYRYVGADATLATFADADLGGGTAYSGVELGAAIFAHRQIQVLASYFDYRRWPRMSERVQRVFFDLVWSY
jgi:hypothetical protein